MKNLKDIIVVGCGGHSRFVISMALNNGYLIKGIIDTNSKYDESENIMGFNVISSIDSISDIYEKGITNAVIAIGDNYKRDKIYNKLLRMGFNFPNLIHSSSCIDDSAIIETANIIGPNVVIGSEVMIGKNNILNTGSIIEHQSVIGDSNHVSLSSIICGKVKIGNNVFLGANSTVIQNIKIADDVIVGAGTTIISNVEAPGSVIVGAKSRLVKK